MGGDEWTFPQVIYFFRLKTYGLFRLGCGENRNVRVFLCTKPHFSEKVPHFLENKGHFSKKVPHFLQNELHFLQNELHFLQNELHFLQNEPLFCNAPQKHFDGLPTDVAHLR